ncbi:MAG: lipopolysaccharide transport periplasmic protein LptA [Campylobacteraceae bacterium]|nr:lipopolysaccharide transport periplasmic protein LptA [Campylobacteraceae bacterium]
MRIFILYFIIISFSFARQVEITADKFSANEVTGMGEFVGNVTIKKGKDILKSNMLIVKFNQKRKPTKYIAKGNVFISINIKDKKYLGKGDKLIYDPIKDRYSLEGNAFLEDKISNKKIYGNSIHVNQKDGKYDVDSSQNGPVKFVFQIDDGVKW